VKLAEKPLIGYGLRAAENEVMWGTVENSYLTLAYDTGIIGLILWLAIWAMIALRGLKALNRGNYSLLPWVHFWLIICLAFTYANMHFQPLVWIAAGVILGTRPSSRSLG
jgi:O-antigen ligase